MISRRWLVPVAMLLLVIGLAQAETEQTTVYKPSHFHVIRSSVAAVDTTTWDGSDEAPGTVIDLRDHRFPTLRIGGTFSINTGTATLVVVRGEWDGQTFHPSPDVTITSISASTLGTIGGQSPWTSFTVDTAGASGAQVLVTALNAGTVTIGARNY